jgi:exopolysaccharide biosynthesis protein
LYGQNQTITYLDIDTDASSVSVRPLYASNHELETVPVIAAREARVLAGINGGYFYNNLNNDPNYHDGICPSKTYPQTGELGDSLLQIDGRLITPNCDNTKDANSHYSRSALAIDAKHRFYIQMVAPNQALKNLEDPAHPNVAYAIGGGPGLIATDADGNGFIQITDEGFDHVTVKSGRAAVGLLKGHHLIMLTVDGKTGVSGMTIAELADFMLNYLHVSAALNLDGGGSTSLCIKPNAGKVPNCKIVNHPSDAAGPRKVYDGVFVLSNDTPAA